ncbi:Putative flippase GtrA (transmembrane translocase of bactoprenol-linked glucose) [Duganella sp. CF517]|uniref:GtrA family protein n=1 Tax=Duganella sp. CF517 TaxID=1881038 RepID=UPI0008C4F556|nr:GtrA family protein [Duganella sp. CF517]SEN48661.1 Putative flippase GtrA (transmembrane translocase of bactoprenol-linked glucose) [Duganella sp. CF517]
MRLDTAFLIKFLQFACIGGVVFLFDASCFWLLIKLTGWPSLARVISVALAITLSWALNRALTFRRQAGRADWRELLKFAASQLPGACINAGASLLAFHSLPFTQNNAWLSTAVGSIAGLFANFIMANFFVFNKKNMTR